MKIKKSKTIGLHKQIIHTYFVEKMEGSPEFIKSLFTKTKEANIGFDLLKVFRILLIERIKNSFLKIITKKVSSCV